MSQACGTCAHFDSKYPEPIFGLCRRFPPVVTGASSRFPEVHSGSGCGEWKKAKPEPGK